MTFVKLLFHWRVTWKSIIAASMYFWSVSLVYQLSSQFLIFLVDQKNFGIPKKILVYQKEIWSAKKRIWTTRKIFAIPKKNLVDQTNEKLTRQLVYQRDWPKLHGRRLNLSIFFIGKYQIRCIFCVIDILKTSIFKVLYY